MLHCIEIHMFNLYIQNGNKMKMYNQFNKKKLNVSQKKGPPFSRFICWIDDRIQFDIIFFFYFVVAVFYLTFLHLTFAQKGNKCKILIFGFYYYIFR